MGLIHTHTHTHTHTVIQVLFTITKKKTEDTKDSLFRWYQDTLKALLRRYSGESCRSAVTVPVLTDEGGFGLGVTEKHLVLSCRYLALVMGGSNPTLHLS